MARHHVPCSDGHRVAAEEVLPWRVRPSAAPDYGFWRRGPRRLDAGTSGPRDYLELRAFQRHGIQVVFHDYCQEPQIQAGADFVPNLSVVDLLFNEGSAARGSLADHRSETNG